MYLFIDTYRIKVYIYIMRTEEIKKLATQTYQDIKKGKVTSIKLQPVISIKVGSITFVV